MSLAIGNIVYIDFDQNSSIARTFSIAAFPVWISESFISKSHILSYPVVQVHNETSNTVMLYVCMRISWAHA